MCLSHNEMNYMRNGHKCQRCVAQQEQLKQDRACQIPLARGDRGQEESFEVGLVQPAEARLDVFEVWKGGFVSPRQSDCSTSGFIVEPHRGENVAWLVRRRRTGRPIRDRHDVAQGEDYGFRVEARNACVNDVR